MSLLTAIVQIGIEKIGWRTVSETAGEILSSQRGVVESLYEATQTTVN
ncbi:hypothetical protein [Chlorogloea sp. CCALA 695]|nr:hypothetical protein [Chlorogloea sp. CCALA 695]